MPTKLHKICILKPITKYLRLQRKKATKKTRKTTPIIEHKAYVVASILRYVHGSNQIHYAPNQKKERVEKVGSTRTKIIHGYYFEGPHITIIGVGSAKNAYLNPIRVTIYKFKPIPSMRNDITKLVSNRIRWGRSLIFVYLIPRGFSGQKLKFLSSTGRALTNIMSLHWSFSLLMKG